MPRFKFSPGGCGCTTDPVICPGCPERTTPYGDIHVSFTNIIARRAGSMVLTPTGAACEWTGTGPPDSFDGSYLTVDLFSLPIGGPSFVAHYSDSAGVIICEPATGVLTVTSCEPLDITFTPNASSGTYNCGFRSFHITE